MDFMLMKRASNGEDRNGIASVFVGTISYLAASAMTSGSAFITALLVARFLGKDGLGVYAVCATGVMLGVMIADMGMDSLVIRNFARNANPGTTPFSAVLATRLTTSLTIAMLASIAILILQLRPFGAAFASALFIVPRSLSSSMEAYFKSRQRRRLLFIESTVAGGASVAFVAALLLTSQGLSTVMLGLLGVESIRALFLAYLLRDSWRDFHRVGAGAIVHVIRQGIPFALIGIVSYICARADVFLLAYLLGSKAAGIFTGADRIVALGNLVAFSLYGSALPIFSSIQDPVHRRRLVREALAYGTFFAGGAALVLYLSAPFLVNQTFRFAESIGVLRILAFTIPLMVANTILGTALFAAHEEKTIATILSAVCLTNITLNILLIPVFGVSGAACLSVATEAIFTVIYGFVYSRRARIALQIPDALAADVPAGV
jgi:O-antigen/teichoic acid export membrane protein